MCSQHEKKEEEDGNLHSKKLSHNEEHHLNHYLNRESLQWKVWAKATWHLQSMTMTDMGYRQTVRELTHRNNTPRNIYATTQTNNNTISTHAVLRDRGARAPLKSTQHSTIVDFSSTACTAPFDVWYGDRLHSENRYPNHRWHFRHDAHLYH
jgi:hypothetical protein